MAVTVQFRRYTTAELGSLTPAEGELFVDLDKDVVVVGDGSTAGGFALQSELVSGTNLKTVNGNSLLGSGDVDLSTSLALNGTDLVYTNIDGTEQTISLAGFLDDTTNTVASASLDGNTITFTREDATTFTLDVTNLYDDTNLVTSVGGATGAVTLTGGTNVSVDGTIISVPTSNIWNAFTFGDGLNFVEGTLTATGGGGGISNVVEDTTPQLGGDLDAQNNDIVNVSRIDGSGIGTMYIYPATGQQLRIGDQYNSGAVYLGAEGGLYLQNQKFPMWDGTTGQVLTTNGAGTLSWSTVSGGGGISNVVEDTTPQLGGDLDCQLNDIVNPFQIRSSNSIYVYPQSNKDLYLGDAEQTYDIHMRANGTINIKGGVSGGIVKIQNLTYPSSDGTEGQVLTTNGSGALSWSTVSGGGASSLNDLSDVNMVTTPDSNDFYLKWSTDYNAFIPYQLQPQTSLTTYFGNDIYLKAYGAVGNGGNINLITYAEGGDRGDVIIQGLKYPQADGSEGQVLTTNGAGTLSWANVSGGGGIALDNLSATTATPEGTGGLSYNNTTGVFTMYPPDLSGYYSVPDDVWSTFTFGSGLSFSGGTLTATSQIAGYSGDDINIRSYGAVGNPGNVTLTTYAEGGDRGDVIIQGLKYPQADGSEGQVLTTNGAGVLSFADASGGGGLPDGVILGVIGDSSVTPTVYNGYRKLLTITRDSVESVAEFNINWTKNLRYSTTTDAENGGFMSGTIMVDGADTGWLNQVRFIETYRTNAPSPYFYITYVDGNTAEIWVNNASASSSWTLKHEAVWGLSGTYDAGHGVTIEVAPSDTPIVATPPTGGLAYTSTQASNTYTRVQYATTLSSYYAVDITAGPGIVVAKSGGYGESYTISTNFDLPLLAISASANTAWQTVTFTFETEADYSTFIVNAYEGGPSFTVTDALNTVGSLYWSFTMTPWTNAVGSGYFDGVGYKVDVYGSTIDWVQSVGASGPGLVSF